MSAIIPSSPPLLPSSPPSKTTIITGQKRFFDIDPSSDDIPVFSSDDLPPKEVFENPYHAYRRSARTVKRHRSGTVRSILKHTLPSDAIDPLSSTNQQLNQSDNNIDNGDNGSESGSEGEGDASLNTIRPPATSEPDRSDAPSEDPHDTEANLIIQKAIENGSEVVDLSNLALTHTPTDIHSLSSLILQPKASSSSSKTSPKKSTTLLRSSSGIDPSLSSPYTPLHPKIHLHLHHNSLTTLPPSLTSLKTITGLYLRKNLLRSLPHHISNLTSLTHLSLGENLLAYLPFSLLSLQNLTPTAGLSFFPNPFFTFDSQDTPKRSLNPISLPKSAHASNPSKAFISSTTTSHFIYNFIASTPISAFNELGQLVTPPLTPSLHHPTQWPKKLESPPLPLLSNRQVIPKNCIIHKFPTLQELCLRKIAGDGMYTTLNKPQRRDIYSLLPPHLSRKVKSALEESVKVCSVCKSGYVTKAAEWIEFWDVIPCDDGGVEYSEVEAGWGRFLKRYLGRGGERSNVLPLLREGCSWECVEVWMGEREGEEGG
ncbi:hypothetical protein TWF481_002301 [Arthrobotrys musiformis]|uniref:Uncharacterized protein n=1 Tax=Arthrobotrys musiformis TaxID=47236 RepID=A0AAV9VSS7_9PEZI